MDALDAFYARKFGSIHQDGANIFAFEIGIIGEYFGGRHARRKQFQDGLCRIAQSTDYGLSMASFRIDRDPGKKPVSVWICFHNFIAARREFLVQAYKILFPMLLAISPAANSALALRTSRMGFTSATSIEAM